MHKRRFKKLGFGFGFGKSLVDPRSVRYDVLVPFLLAMAVIIRKVHAVVVKVPRNRLVRITVCNIMAIVAKPYQWRI